MITVASQLVTWVNDEFRGSYTATQSNELFLLLGVLEVKWHTTATTITTTTVVTTAQHYRDSRASTIQSVVLVVLLVG